MARTRTSRAPRDLPALPSGEPVLARWFVIGMIVLVPLGIAVTIWTVLSFSRPELTPAERRPPGDATVTHDRGDAALNRTRDVSAGPDCASEVEVVGDAGAIAAGRRALAATCQLLGTGDFPDAEAGLVAWAAGDGILRFAVFELTGVDASSRVLDDGRVAIELNARFQFEDAAAATPPFLLHELVHLGRGGWPGAPVTADDELAAMQVQAGACDRLAFRDQPPRGCEDARALVGAADPLGQLRAAGYRPGS